MRVIFFGLKWCLEQHDLIAMMSPPYNLALKDMLTTPYNAEPSPIAEP